MGTPRIRDDAGGVWIWTGWALGALVYVGVVVAWHAGFAPALPFVVIPPLLLVMIGAGNWISGRRAHRPPPRFNRPDLGDPAPASSPAPASAPDGETGPPA